MQLEWTLTSEVLGCMLSVGRKLQTQILDHMVWLARGFGDKYKEKHAQIRRFKL
jgi:hypothetical protein